MTGFLITDIAGSVLSSEEREWIQHPYIAGIILFTRNYKHITQLSHLVQSIQEANPSLFIFVDQEGGRVQRFRDNFTAIKPMRYFGDLYQTQPAQAELELKAIITCVVDELKTIGISVNCIPVLDLDDGTSAVIGSRSLGADPDTVIKLGSCIIDALHAQNMPAMGKHFPGHGGVAGDSHEILPVDHRDRRTIEQYDLMPFQILAKKLDAIMPAHVVYQAFDDKPAGFSRYWLQDVLRQQLGFTGVVVSDDLSMAGAASIGSYFDRAVAALEAGCDLLMACNQPDAVRDLLRMPLSTYCQPDSEQRIIQFKEKTEACRAIKTNAPSSRY